MINRSLAVLAVAGLALAQQPVLAVWPQDNPVEPVVGFAPGGGTDVMARVLARIVDNPATLVANRNGGKPQTLKDPAFLEAAKADTPVRRALP